MYASNQSTELRDILMDRASLYHGRIEDPVSLVERTLLSLSESLPFADDVEAELYKAMHRLVESN